MHMLRYLAPVLVLVPASASAQAVQPGNWDVTSKVVDLAIPGVPGFLARMIKGKSKAEHKRLSAGEGIEALLLPDPKAMCRVDTQRIGDGHYAQTLSCPQKHGEPMHITRTGSYGTGGFVGQATVTGTTPKGPLSIALEQHAARVGG
ncbi:DUF3617 domain-containing protein [Sphingomonas bacterium]|uniref:DUF3617 domain-containing protein n=1 Tax=Sphingomonas bacterium TaxID=1895847 RepID=UPI0015759E3C|nr:DUF3617 family protein [Sphingomonas bacterium]